MHEIPPPPPPPRRPAGLPARFLPWLACLGTGLAAACSPQSAAADSAAQEELAGGARQREVPSVQVGAVERRGMTAVLETTSKLESEHEVRLFPRSPGVVAEILVEEGDPVREDDVLARLDERDEALAEREAEVAFREAEQALQRAKLAVEEALAGVDRAHLAADQTARDYERDRQLFEGSETASALSKKALEASLLARDNAQSDLRQAEISHRKALLEVEAAETAATRAKTAWERAQLALSYRRILAPIDGVIASRNIRVGDTVGSGEPAFVLTDPTRLRAVFQRPQEELSLFDRRPDGEPIGFTATAEAHPGHEFTGRVERISPTIDPASGQFRVTARILPRDEDEAAMLVPGMLIRMRIVTDRHPDALVVPKRATEREGDRNFVRVFEPLPGEERLGRIRLVDFDEGYSDDVYAELIPEEPGSLGEGTLVVFVGRDDLQDGDTVERVSDGRTPAARPSPPSDGEASPPAAEDAAAGHGGEASDDTETAEGA